MSQAIKNIQNAIAYAEKIRPKVGGFPYLAEVLRQAGVARNYWYLPSCQSTFITADGPVTMQGEPLATGLVDVPAFEQEALICALRADQAGETTFREFLLGSWHAGVVYYDVNFDARTVSYYGVAGEVYVEAYPQVSIQPS